MAGRDAGYRETGAGDERFGDKCRSIGGGLVDENAAPVLSATTHDRVGQLLASTDDKWFGYVKNDSCHIGQGWRIKSCLSWQVISALVAYSNCQAVSDLKQIDLAYEAVVELPFR
jgi:hypothetical protein